MSGREQGGPKDDQEGELRVVFDLPVVQTTAQYHQQLQGLRTFDVYKDPELERLCRELFQAVRVRVEVPDPERQAVSCGSCRDFDEKVCDDFEPMR